MKTAEAPAILRERRKTPPFDDGRRRYYDRDLGVTVVKVFAGECRITSSPSEMLATVLGSCVAACVHDPVAGVGGMNHFMLPESPSRISGGVISTLRYGNLAMCALIDGVLAMGGHRERLQITVFGGGNVMDFDARIGDQNADFVEQYLREEGFMNTTKDLRGDRPRRVHFFPTTGKAKRLLLCRKTDFDIFGNELTYRRRLSGLPRGPVIADPTYWRDGR